MIVPRLVVFDLDDTLFPERAYVRSGFDAVDECVRARWGCTGFVEVAWELYLNGSRGHIFDEALARLGLAPGRDAVRELVWAYRGHRPTITFFPDVGRAVATLRKSARTAIVSDGALRSQQHKVEALRLDECFSPIILTDRWGEEFWKPHPRAFQELEAVTGCNGAECVYVGDNPRKDFVAPRALGWWTVRVRRPHGEHAAVEAPAAAHSECVDLDQVVRVLGMGLAEEGIDRAVAVGPDLWRGEDG